MAPEMYSLGYQHATPSDLASLGIGYGSLGTRTATPGPPDTDSMHSIQTPRGFEEVNTYNYDGDGDVVMQDLEDLKAIMDVMHHVYEKRFRDEQLYQREANSSRVRILRRFVNIISNALLASCVARSYRQASVHLSDRYIIYIIPSSPCGGNGEST